MPRERSENDIAVKWRALEKAYYNLPRSGVGQNQRVSQELLTREQLLTFFESFKELKEEILRTSRELRAGLSDGRISEFLEKVGQAAVSAQQSLDRQVLGADSGGMPAMFRIPKVEAEIKFAIEEIESEDINIFFYGKEGTEKDLNQQSVKFEVQATPPTPEMLQYLRDRRLPFRALADVREREVVRSRLSPELAAQNPLILLLEESPRPVYALLFVVDVAAVGVEESAAKPYRILLLAEGEEPVELESEHGAKLFAEALRRAVARI